MKAQPFTVANTCNLQPTPPTMKKILALLAATLSLGVLTPSTAEAAHGSSSYVVGKRVFARHCGLCGAPIYRVRYIAYHHRDGRPEYRWRTLSHVCRPHHHGGHHHGHSH